jgi:hypothetical protein
MALSDAKLCQVLTSETAVFKNHLLHPLTSRYPRPTRHFALELRTFLGFSEQSLSDALHGR